jgi:hypothetical protein
MDYSSQSGGNAADSTVQQLFCAKNRRLVYNRTRRFSALTGNRDRSVPDGTGTEVRQWS